MSAKLIYGNGNCSIQGSDVRGIQIKYNGNITIEDKTSTSFVLINNNNGILIFPISKKGALANLFDYSGELTINSIIASDSDGKSILTSINRSMDYAELLGVSETITLNSEKLNSSKISNKKLSKDLPLKNILPNLNTSDWDLVLYLKDGKEYKGSFHIHLKDNTAMTGKMHDDHSEELYYMKETKLTPTKNPSLIPQNTRKPIAKNRLVKVSKNNLTIKGGY